MSSMTEAFKTAFTEWDRRYREDPSQFSPESDSPEDYGKAAGEYFEKLLNELAGGKPWETIGGGETSTSEALTTTPGQDPSSPEASSE